MSAGFGWSCLILMDPQNLSRMPSIYNKYSPTLIPLFPLTPLTIPEQLLSYFALTIRRASLFLFPLFIFILPVKQITLTVHLITLHASTDHIHSF
ncbi:hypothetical protein BGZ57DRAFT_913793 [Hyaloscypha finlandica]|nr:hypothetical protein BGZ57DRAFT_913793 [Hyaloscypha finlandica]